MKYTLLSTLLLVCAGACSTPDGGAGGGRPQSVALPERPQGGEIVADGGAGSVLWSGEDQKAMAEMIADSMASITPEVIATVGYRNTEELEVWLVPDFDAPYRGYTFRRSIIINTGGWRDTRYFVFERALAHELVHWHLADSPVTTNMPIMLQEGLCDRLSLDLMQDSPLAYAVPAEYALLLSAARSRGELPELIARLELSAVDATGMPPQERDYLYALGLALVDRIGVRPLLEGAGRGPLVPADLLEMAGIDSAGGGLDLVLPMPAKFQFSSDSGADLASSPTNAHSSPVPSGAVRCWIAPSRQLPRSYDRELLVRFRDSAGDLLDEQTLPIPGSLRVPRSARTCSTHLALPSATEVTGA